MSINVNSYETVVGLEVHVELATKTKMFCACKNSFGAPPNTHVCPVCMGLPGALPSLNGKAVEYAVRAGLALGCKINNVSRMDRKNYFYPDLPKGYQISQAEYPLCVDGGVDISTSEGSKRIRIERIHIEEDAGKLIHSESGETLIDLNRCGVPLIEIVSSPDISSADEAKAYLSELRSILLHIGVSDCKLNEGSFRCDVNLSVRRRGDTALGVRTEMKNINSLNFVAKAIEYEAARQISLIERGESVVRETRRFDSQSGKTHTMRRKEIAADYKFFREPDILPFSIDPHTVERMRGSIGELPSAKIERYVRDFGIGKTDAKIIVSSPSLCSFFESAAALTPHVRTVSNIIISELLANTSADDFECSLSASDLASIAELCASRTINSSTVKRIIKLLGDSEYAGYTPERLVCELELAQISDISSLKCVLDTAVEQSPKLLADYKTGKSAAKKAIVGKVMALTSGRADPVIVSELIDKL